MVHLPTVVLQEHGPIYCGRRHLSAQALCGTFRRSDYLLLVGAGKGQLTYLLWDDVTCNSCGGLASKRCIITTTSQPQHSCAGGHCCSPRMGSSHLRKDWCSSPVEPKQFSYLLSSRQRCLCLWSFLLDCRQDFYMTNRTCHNCVPDTVCGHPHC